MTSRQRKREEIRIAFKQPSGKQRPVAPTAAPRMLRPANINLAFDRSKLFDFVRFNGNWVDDISGRAYETIDLALQSAHHNIRALGDYSTPLKELRRLYKEATQNDR